jgi:hypothetical protein
MTNNDTALRLSAIAASGERVWCGWVKEGISAMSLARNILETARIYRKNATLVQTNKQHDRSLTTVITNNIQYSKGLRKFQKVHLFLKGAQSPKVFDYAESEFDVSFYV